MMKKLFAILAVLALSTSCAVAATQTWTWDFNDGTSQGWNLYANTGGGGAAPPAYIVDPGQDMAGDFAAYLPDKNAGQFDITSLAGLANGSKSWRFETTVGFNWLKDEYNADNRLQACGIAAMLGDDVWPTFWWEGKQSGSSRMVMDASDNTPTKLSLTGGWEIDGCLKDTNQESPDGMIARLFLDYNNMAEGILVAGIYGINYRPYVVDNLNSGATVTTPLEGTIEGFTGPFDGVHFGYAYINNDPLTGDLYAAKKLQIGGEWSWAQAYFDDVTFTAYDVVPEPGSIVALASGLVGLAGFGIRRRK